MPAEFSDVLLVADTVLVTAMLLAFYRLVKGPSLPDRVMALDMIGTVAMGAIVVYAVATRQMVFIDVAIAMALISFLSTVAIAHYLERRGFQ